MHDLWSTFLPTCSRKILEHASLNYVTPFDLLASVSTYDVQRILNADHLIHQVLVRSPSQTLIQTTSPETTTLSYGRIVAEVQRCEHGAGRCRDPWEGETAGCQAFDNDPASDQVSACVPATLSKEVVTPVPPFSPYLLHLRSILKRPLFPLGLVVPARLVCPNPVLAQS